MRTADAAALVACFRRCYGDTYASDDFYDAGKLARRIEAGSLRSVVAIADDGTLVGHTGLTVHHPHARAVEAGNTVVDPAHRGEGLLGRLAAALTDLCTGDGFVGYVHYPTTAHEIMQKASVRGGGVETGVMLDYIPDDTDYRAIERRSGRLAATVVYQPFAPPPARTVYAPTAYHDTIERLYVACGLQRTVIAANDPIQSQTTTSRPSFNARRGLLHIDVERIGRDIGAVIGAHCASRDADVAHVDLCMDEPAVAVACETLCSAGFFYCGLLPEFARADVLRLQRLAHPRSTSFAPPLANDGARRLLAWMLEPPGAGA